jgi:2'-5' RNA ligase
LVALLRLFIGVPIDPDTTLRLVEWLKQGAADHMPGRKVPAENWHFTLRFLGDVDDVGRDRLLASLHHAELGDPFDIRFGGLDAFPRPSKASFVWSGVTEGVEELTELAAEVEEACVDAGFDPEDRPFRAHLTFARVRPPADARRLIESTPPSDIGMRVDSVVLYRSHLGDTHPRYEVVESFDLG